MSRVVPDTTLHRSPNCNQMIEEAMLVEESMGNAFADLGLANPEERLLKAELGRQIRDLITTRELTQTAAGKLLGVPQSHVSTLVRGKLAGFSVERLVGYLNALGQDVEIVVTPSPHHAPGRIRVTGPEHTAQPVPAGRRSMTPEGDVPATV